MGEAGDGAGDVGRIIETDDCVAEGTHWLVAHDARMAHARDIAGVPPLRRRPDGFAQLLGAIVSQQVSTAAARAVWGRLESAGLTGAAAIAQADDAALRAAGLSRQKARYARALAAAGIDFDALRRRPTDAVVRELTSVTGIGVWTAEIYAMFSLGRADVFAPGDLALQEATRILYGLEARPKEREMRAMAARWSPWRAVAARLLWAYYHVEKQREGIA